MRMLLRAVLFSAGLLLASTAVAQPPGDKGPDRAPPGDRPPPPGDRPPADGPRGKRGDQRPDDGPPPPGKAGPRGRRDGDAPHGPPGPPDGGPRRGPPDAPGRGPAGGFGEGFGGRGAGGGGFGGRRGEGGGFGDFRPGMPGPGWGPFGGGNDDPEIRDLVKQDADLDRQTHEMAVRVRQARGEERAKLKQDLTDLAKKHFAVRQKRREHQLARMEEELKRLRDTIAKRQSSSETIIENHVKELIGDPSDLDF